MEGLINKLEGVKDFLFELAKITRDQQERILRFFQAYEAVGKAIDVMMEKQIPTEIEIEGGGHTWWHVCGECHGAIDSSDRYCKHCGRKLMR